MRSVSTMLDRTNVDDIVRIYLENGGKCLARIEAKSESSVTLAVSPDGKAAWMMEVLLSEGTLHNARIKGYTVVRSTERSTYKDHARARNDDGSRPLPELPVGGITPFSSSYDRELLDEQERRTRQPREDPEDGYTSGVLTGEFS